MKLKGDVGGFYFRLGLLEQISKRCFILSILSIDFSVFTYLLAVKTRELSREGILLQALQPLLLHAVLFRLARFTKMLFEYRAPVAVLYDFIDLMFLLTEIPLFPLESVVSPCNLHS